MSGEFKLSDARRQQAKELRHNNASWASIAKLFGCTIDNLRRQIDPIWRQKRNAQIASAKRAHGPAPAPTFIVGQASIGPRRDDALYDPMRDGDLPRRNPFSDLMGEPPVGRSALDRRNGQHVGG